VLYVEDNLSNLRLVERILERRPTLRLVAATQGQLAVELAREHHPALILLDVHLPDIDGDEVLERHRADSETVNIPVVVVSAEATPGKIERFLAAGARTYLTKPLDVNRLLEVIDEITTAPTAVRRPQPPLGPTATPEHRAEPLNGDIIAALRELDETPPGGRLTDLVADFCDEAAARVAELRTAVRADNTAATERLAHSLRGTSANFGANRLPELCGRLERLATANEPIGAELVDDIEAELGLVCAALRNEFRSTT
jgi:CheY-like chemotaxis protein/HPt (histidine-containing phosphotransfer) domain-containing protein